MGDKKAEASPPPGAREAQSGPQGVAEPEQPGLTRSQLANDQEPAFHQLRKLQFLDYIWIVGVQNRPSQAERACQESGDSASNLFRIFEARIAWQSNPGNPQMCGRRGTTFG